MESKSVEGQGMPEQELDISINGKTLIHLFRSDEVKSSLATLLQRARARERDRGGNDPDYEQEVRFFLNPEDLNAPLVPVESAGVGPSSVSAVESFEEQIAWQEKNLYQVMGIHTHPSERGRTYNPLGFIPSRGDLNTLAGDRTQETEAFLYTGFPISMIGLISGKGINLRLIQETPYAPRSKTARDQCVDDLLNTTSEKEISEALEQYGYKTTTITYSLTGKKRMSTQDEQKLHRFSFTLQRKREANNIADQ